MKKMQGIVDPISLAFVLILGIAAAGSIGNNKASEQQLAQDTQTELTASAEAAHEYLAEN